MTRSIDRGSAPEDVPGVQPPHRINRLKQRFHTSGDTCGGLPRPPQPPKPQSDYS